MEVATRSNLIYGGHTQLLMPIYRSGSPTVTARCYLVPAASAVEACAL